MSTISYEEILRKVQGLKPTDQLRLLEDLARLVRRRAMPQPNRSIMELQGLGKEVWSDIDVQEYIDRERDSWNG